MKKIRLKFNCWNCQKNYEMTLEVVGKPDLLVACPFCQKEGVVDLDPDRGKTKLKVVYRSDDKPGLTIDDLANLPDVLPTRKSMTR